MTPAPISVERFKLTLVGDINGLIGPFPAVEASPHGDFIRHSDYAALLRQLDELERELSQSRDFNAELNLLLDTAKQERDVAERAREEACGLLREVASDYGARHFPVMLNRGQVEYMLQVAIDHGHEVDAELCRAWLALDAAPVGHVPVYSPGSSVGAVSVWFDEGVSADPISGQRVRLVAASGNNNG